MNLFSNIRDGVDAHEAITVTSIRCWPVGQELITVAPAMAWHEGEPPSAEASMGGAELEQSHYFGGWELPE